MVSRKKQTLEAIAERWRRTAGVDAARGRRLPLPLQNRSSRCILSIETEYPTTQHIESIATQSSGTGSYNAGSNASQAPAGQSSSFAMDESGAMSSSSSDESCTSDSAGLSIPGTGVFAISSATGSEDQSGPAAVGVQVNATPSALAAGTAARSVRRRNNTNNAKRHNPRVSRVLSSSNHFDLHSPQTIAEAVSSSQRLARERESVRARAQSPYLNNNVEFALARRRNEEALLAAYGYNPRDLNPDPLHSHPVCCSCNHCNPSSTAHISTQSAQQLCFNCRPAYSDQIRFDYFMPPYSDPVLRSRINATDMSRDMRVRYMSMISARRSQAASAGSNQAQNEENTHNGAHCANHNPNGNAIGYGTTNSNGNGNGTSLNSDEYVSYDEWIAEYLQRKGNTDHTSGAPSGANSVSDGVLPVQGEQSTLQIQDSHNETRNENANASVNGNGQNNMNGISNASGANHENDESIGFLLRNDIPVVAMLDYANRPVGTNEGYRTDVNTDTDTDQGQN